MAKKLNNQDIEAEVKRIIKEQLGVEENEIKPYSDLVDDLHADDLDLVEITMAFGETFKIPILDEDVKEWRTVQDAMSFIIEYYKG